MNERDRIAALMGAPITIPMNDGKEYQFSPLNIGELEDLARHCRYAKLRDVTRETKEFPEDVRNRLIDKAYEECSNLSQQDLEAAIKSIAGCRFMLWLGLRHNHPDLTLEQMSALLDVTNMLGVQKHIDLASGDADPTSSRPAESLAGVIDPSSISIGGESHSEPSSRISS